MPARTNDRAMVHVQRRERDAARQAERRAESARTGVPLGHKLDALVLDAVAIMLTGRASGDPVRSAFERGLAQAIDVRHITASEQLRSRLQARLTPSYSLKGAQERRALERKGL